MTSIELKKLLLGTTLIAGFTAFMTTPSFAQDADDAEEVVEVVTADEDEDDDDEIIVTGSRLKKTTFNSIKPLQVIDFDETEEIGLVDTVEILQTNEAAAGVQIDSAFGGFVLDNGPGSETIDLRGLGPDRTLLLVNGRRLAPLGVEGAPSQPSINTIPSLMIDNVDLLLEGASSVYGSDALAGVINVTIARDFEGLEVAANTELAEQGGEDYTVGARYGKNWDRAFFSIAGEYSRRDGVRLSDRDFLNDCQTNVEITETGEIRFNNVEDAVAQELFNGLRANPKDRDNPCVGGATTSRFIELSPTIPYGSVFANRVGANENVLGIPGYTDPFVFFSFDADGDRVIDNSLRDFSINGNDNTAHLIAPQERYNIFSYGEFTIDGAANVTPFYEVSYSNTQINQDLGNFQLFPDVGADNPFNPCGVNAVIDCNLGARFNPDFSLNPEGLYNSPSYIQDFNTFQRDIDPNRDGDTRDARICATFFADFDADGNLIPGTGPFDNAACTPDLFGLGLSFAGPIDVLPVVTIDGDRTLVDLNLQQTRIVGGFKGDIPGSYDPDGFINFSDFNWEVSLSHNISSGNSSRPGIRDDRLNYALGNDQFGTPVAGRAPCTGDSFTDPDVTNGCVPVNLFAPAANEIQGRLTAAEHAYLFDTRDFDTQYFQTVLNGFVAGQIADVPAGKVQASVGFEHRVDEIDSRPDDIARDGKFFGFFSDQGASGSRHITEVFGEVSLPILADTFLFEKLDVEAGARWLDDEFFGNHAVYTVAGGWRPVDSLLLRASYGTSFRAPNLRELFQQPQSGFTSVFDPCIAPGNAFVPVDITDPNGPTVYNPGLDGRDPEVIARCVREGLPVDLGGGNTTAFPGVEVFGEGSLELDPEESTSLTIGASFEQPFTDRFELDLAVNYYDIDVANTVISPGAQFIVNDCFTIDRTTRSAFCDRIERDADQEINFVGLGFINRDEEEVRGLDFNANFNIDFSIGDRPLTWRTRARANHLLERRTLIVDDEGNAFPDTDDGQFGFAKWTGSLVNQLDYKDFRVSWFTRWIGDVEQDPDGIDDFGNAFGIDTDDNGFADTFGDTCLGPNFGDVNCRDVGFADDYFVHNASLSYLNEELDLRLIVGVNNVFDETPPLVDGSEVTSLSNAPIGAGYNLNGRTFVASIRKGF